MTASDLLDSPATTKVEEDLSGRVRLDEHTGQ
jgi:hypothetical protein